MSDYLKYNACRQHTLLPIVARTGFGISVKKAASDKIRRSSWREKNKK
jgi:hypothetical protein